MSDREQVYTILGMTLISMQHVENSLKHLLIHIYYQQHGTEPLPKVLKSFERTLGTLITIWKGKGMPDGWEEKMEEVRLKRNWVAHHFAHDRALFLCQGKFNDVYNELFELFNLFVKTIDELEKLIEQHVQRVAALRGFDRKKLQSYINIILGQKLSI